MFRFLTANLIIGCEVRTKSKEGSVTVPDQISQASLILVGRIGTSHRVGLCKILHLAELKACS
jgi:hypothetical protein